MEWHLACGVNLTLYKTQMQTQFYKDHVTQIKMDPNIGYKPNFLGLQ